MSSTSASEQAFKFVNDPRAYESKNARVAHLPGSISNKTALLESLASLLTFPSYFGHNWDALTDCLGDLSWVDQRLVVLVHERVPAIGGPDQGVYLDLLVNAVRGWREGESHALEVVFPESDRPLISIAVWWRFTVARSGREPPSTTPGPGS